MDEINLFDIVTCHGENWLVTQISEDDEEGMIYLLQRPSGEYIVEQRKTILKNDVTIKGFDSLIVVLESIKKGDITIKGVSFEDFKVADSTTVSVPEKTTIELPEPSDEDTADSLIEMITYEGNLNRLLDKLANELYHGNCTSETLRELEDMEHRKG